MTDQLYAGVSLECDGRTMKYPNWANGRVDLMDTAAYMPHDTIENILLHSWEPCLSLGANQEPWFC